MAKAKTETSLEEFVGASKWKNLEEHLDDLRERVDASITLSNELRSKYREELLASNPGLRDKIIRPSDAALENAQNLLGTGTVAASDGTVTFVPLLGGSKIQVGVVIVFNHGEVVDWITKVFETEITERGANATDFFSNLRGTRKISNILARAIMLYGERKLLLDERADWRMLHGELIPHELRTGAGRPEKNLGLAFDLVGNYVNTKQFLAVSEASDDIDILNAAILLEPGEYVVVKSLEDTLTSFLEGDEATGQSRANFSRRDEAKFREFIKKVGPQVTIVLAKAGNKPFLLECHSDRVEEAVALFLADSLWTRGFPMDGSGFTVRGFPFHIDLADQIARTLIKGSEFQNFVECRLFDLNVESGVFEIDARRTRV